MLRYVFLSMVLFPSIAFAQISHECKGEVPGYGYTFPGMNPYEGLGACGVDYLARIVGNRQWLSENSVLIVSPSEDFPPVLIVGKVPLHDYHKYLFQKIKPISYTNSLGVLTNPQTYQALEDKGK